MTSFISSYRQRLIPVFSVVLILALAVGVATPVFSIVHSILLRPLPLENADRLVYLREANESEGKLNYPISFLNYQDWKTQSESLEDLSAFTEHPFILEGFGNPRPIMGAYVTGGFFNVFGAKIQLGRTPQPDELNVVILSNKLWHSTFAGDQSIIGTDVRLNQDTFKVIGVTAPGFVTSSFIDMLLWIPLANHPDFTRWSRESRSLRVVGKLKESVGISEARAELSSIAARLENAYPASNTGWSVKVTTLLSRVVEDTTRRGLFLLGVVAIFAVLVAWLNMTVLLLSMGLSRRKEFAIRCALGATPGKLSVMLAKEILMPCLFASSLGLLLSYWLLSLLRHLDPGIPRLQEVSFDWTALLMAVFLTFMNTVVAAIFTWRMTRFGLNSALKETGSSIVQGGRSRKQNIIAAAEIALALVLVAATVSSLDNFVRLQKTNLGFNTEDVFYTQIMFRSVNGSQQGSSDSDIRIIESRLEQIPFIKNAGSITTMPLTGRGIESMDISSRLNPATVEARFLQVTPGFFQSMGIPVLAGRSLTDSDRIRTSRSALVNQTLARLLGGEEYILGEQIKARSETRENDFIFDIVGITGDIREDGPSGEIHPSVYYPYERNPRGVVSFVTRSDSEGSIVVEAIHDVIGEVGKDLVILESGSVQNLLDREYLSRPRFGFMTLALLAFLAIGSAVGGLYGAMTYQVNLRKKEIGIRMSLGADRKNIFKLVLGWGLKISITGLIIGILIVLVLTTWISSILLNTEAASWQILAASSLFLILVTLVIVVHPAWRAASVQPIEVIKNLQ